MEEKTVRTVDLEEWLEEGLENLMNSRLNNIKKILEKDIVENNKIIEAHPYALLVHLYCQGRLDLAHAVLAAASDKKEPE